ncbi:hypothetical protein KQH42_25060 [Streptomyces sp. CHA1]|nr:hypothetical protein [Streptomyces sp. G11C]MCO6699482.1 hypothetical protein [Streptomyces sp. CHB9.2]MCO6710004.1 hypothetical protein [Streptomyces sp. CHA3]MCO6715778.1 hypothetical protein [Streptomyces sp. CHB19.2]MCO6721909.1 hypothetical protein [Streptomyces sp. Vc714c-19]MCO6727601.1 hypothetical protein [Streptomyces sp. CHA16]MCO6733631.1 hypothetical protein [Streptomyces sp. EL9]MCO6739237.1 hypothetical protein [Streptomyces sp. CHA15]MCO6745518.1 hypothetical protein [Str
MQTIGMKPSPSLTERHRGSPGSEAPTPVLAAAWCATVAAGALLTLTGPGAPWHAALTFVFLAAVPGGAVALTPAGLDPWTRAVAALGATLAVNTLVTQALLTLGTWSARAGVVAAGAAGWLVLTGALAGRLVRRLRTARERVG